MGAQRYVYRERKDGTVARIILDGAPKSRNDPSYDSMSFHERALRSYYEVETSENGYRGAYPKGMVKRVHQEAIARGE